MRTRKVVCAARKGRLVIVFLYLPRLTKPRPRRAKEPSTPLSRSAAPAHRRRSHRLLSSQVSTRRLT